MFIKKQIFLDILSEEFNNTFLKEELSPQAVERIANKLFKKLDSIDISLDLIYGALIGGGQAAAVTRARQRALGRAVSAAAPPQSRMNEREAYFRNIIDEEVDIFLSENQDVNEITLPFSSARKMKKAIDKDDPPEALKHRLGRFVFDKIGKALMGKEDFAKLGGAERRGMYDIIFKNADLSPEDFKKMKAKEIEKMPARELIDLVDIPTADLKKAKEEGEEDAGEGEGAKAKLPKETPLSINTRQKAAKIGGVKELPLNMYMQKQGLDNKTAQKIARRIGDYLKQRNVPIAEALESGFVDNLVKNLISSEELQLMLEATDVSAIKSSIFGKLRLIVGPKTKDETKDMAAKYILGLHNVAVKQPDPEKFRAFLVKRFGGFGGRVENLTEEELRELMSYIQTSDLFKKYHKAGFEWRKGQQAEKDFARKQVRGVAGKADAGVLGKILGRYVSDNQELLGDEALRALFNDTAKFSKFVNTIRKNVVRMMKRRGYGEAEIGKLFESLEKEITNEV